MVVFCPEFAESLYEFIERVSVGENVQQLRDIVAFGLDAMKENLILDTYTVCDLMMQGAYFGMPLVLKEFLKDIGPFEGKFEFSCGRNILHLAANSGCTDTLELCLKFFPKNLVRDRVSAKDKKGWTPLHVAICNDNTLCAKILMEYGANPRVLLHHNSPPSRGVTKSPCVHLAAVKGNVKSLELLMGRLPRCAQDLDESGREPIHYAAYNGNIGAMTCLLENGGRVNAEDDNGRLPAHSCALKGLTEPAALLLKYRPALDRKDNWGMTPYDLAMSLGHSGIAELFKPPFLHRKMTLSEQAAAKEICQKIDEPLVYQVERVIQIIGVERSKKFLEETLRVEAKGGIQKKDGSGKKSKGGVFLDLLKRDLSVREWDFVEA
eukprot:GHVP01027842.1.p1 GENE.GHVP01027842.1~~GHVP01027842.1.p1  ORF type:complete len:387 (+),score=66.53 GHVP01027842.1:25-1161(+)